MLRDPLSNPAAWPLLQSDSNLDPFQSWTKVLSACSPVHGSGIHVGYTGLGWSRDGLGFVEEHLATRSPCNKEHERTRKNDSAGFGEEAESCPLHGHC